MCCNHENYRKKKSLWRRVKKSAKICQIFNNYDENTLRKYYQMIAKNDINEFILYVYKNANEINNTYSNLGSVINELFYTEESNMITLLGKKEKDIKKYDLDLFEINIIEVYNSTDNINHVNLINIIYNNKVINEKDNILYILNNNKVKRKQKKANDIKIVETNVDVEKDQENPFNLNFLGISLPNKNSLYENNSKKYEDV